MSKPTRGRVDPKQQRKEFRALENFYGQAASAQGKMVAQVFEEEPMRGRKGMGELPHIEVSSKVNPLKVKQKPPLESQVLQDIIAYLESRKDIGGIVRTNSGVAQESSRFIRFNTCIGKHDGLYMTLLDLQCIHKPTGRHVEIEVKRTGWKYGCDGQKPNERKQAARIQHLRSCGAVAFFADSVAEVQHQFARSL